MPFIVGSTTERTAAAAIAASTALPPSCRTCRPAADASGWLVVYGRLKDVTVCYRCHSEFRGRYARRASAFDLHTADLLEHEYERKIGRR